MTLFLEDAGWLSARTGLARGMVFFSRFMSRTSPMQHFSKSPNTDSQFSSISEVRPRPTDVETGPRLPSEKLAAAKASAAAILDAATAEAAAQTLLVGEAPCPSARLCRAHHNTSSPTSEVRAAASALAANIGVGPGGLPRPPGGLPRPSQGRSRVGSEACFSKIPGIRFPGFPGPWGAQAVGL